MGSVQTFLIAVSSPFINSPAGRNARAGPQKRSKPPLPGNERDYGVTLYPVTAGRAILRLSARQRGTDKPFVLQIVEFGYLLDFHSKSPITSSSKAMETRTGRNHGRKSTGFIQDRCNRTVPSSSGFLSHVFLVPKKGRKMRPIINLKLLNILVTTPSFCMSTLRDVFQLILQDDWAACLHLKNACFHVLVHPRQPTVHLVGQYIHTHTCLLFGLSTSPTTFIRITKLVVQCLQVQGINSLSSQRRFTPSKLQAEGTRAQG